MDASRPPVGEVMGLIPRKSAECQTSNLVIIRQIELPGPIVLQKPYETPPPCTIGVFNHKLELEKVS